jgi:hypothetical protein
VRLFFASTAEVSGSSMKQQFVTTKATYDIQHDTLVLGIVIIIIIIIIS